MTSTPFPVKRRQLNRALRVVARVNARQSGFRLVELTSKGERKNQNQRLKGTLTAGVIYTMSNVAINSLDPLFTFQALENGSIVGGAARNRAKCIRHSFHQALADARPRAVARTHFEPTAETLT